MVRVHSENGGLVFILLSVFFSLYLSRVNHTYNFPPCCARGLFTLNTAPSTPWRGRRWGLQHSHWLPPQHMIYFLPQRQYPGVDTMVNSLILQNMKMQQTKSWVSLPSHIAISQLILSASTLPFGVFLLYRA
jgi:hypothetical protein